MAFTATLGPPSRGGDPTKINIVVTYTDTNLPDWRETHDLLITLDPTLNPQAQKQAIQQAVRDDASRYFKQNQAFAGLADLEGSQMPITG